jgi:hypothetical protein
VRSVGTPPSAFHRPVPAKLDDDNAERVRVSHQRAIEQLQQTPAAGMRVIQDVTLLDGVATPVQHGLGRLPAWVAPSAPRGAVSSGRIEEVRDGSTDRATSIQLKATGWGATITVDVQVV